MLFNFKNSQSSSGHSVKNAAKREKNIYCLLQPEGIIICHTVDAKKLLFLFYFHPAFPKFLWRFWKKKVKNPFRTSSKESTSLLQNPFYFYLKLFQRSFWTNLVCNANTISRGTLEDLKGNIYHHNHVSTVFVRIS